MAGGRYGGHDALTYESNEALAPMSVVTVPYGAKKLTGFVLRQVDKPSFNLKTITELVSPVPLPYHCLQLAQWMSDYHACSLSEALRQFAPTQATTKGQETPALGALAEEQLELNAPLTDDQKKALKSIVSSPSRTVLLHGDTGTGKTRVYLELAKRSLASGRSVILLTPEISLTTQLAKTARLALDAPVFLLHSQLGEAKRRKIWLQLLETKEPVVVIGPRSALFSPLANLGLIIIDEAHEPAYKQDRTPRYHAIRVASQLATLTDAKVVLGTATPTITDYYLADQKRAVVRMSQPAIAPTGQVITSIVDLKDRSNFSQNPYFSNTLIDAIKATLQAKKQIIIYLNRRGSARLILCKVCGWHFFCPNCDIPLTYHGDTHLARCHICGWHKSPPVVCPKCNNPEIIYRSAGTKSLADQSQKLFPEAVVKRFDSDNLAGEHLNEIFSDVSSGKVDILIGTQILAKGLDLPHLGLVGIIAAEASLALPDYTSEERVFQLLYQVIGRVGRGHGKGQVVIQSYDPGSIVITSAAKRDWAQFYKHSLVERRRFRFPPFSYLMQLVIKRATIKGAETAGQKLKDQLQSKGFKVEIAGPAPSFYARRGRYFYCQLVVKAKERGYLTKLAKDVPNEWQIDIDPVDLL